MTEVPSGNTVDVAEVIAVPMWTAGDGQQPMKPPMEPIPEDEEESGSPFLLKYENLGLLKANMP